jgi:hypothetical protein
MRFSYQGVEGLCDYEPGGSAVCAQNDSSWFEHGIGVLEGEEMTLELAVLHSRGIQREREKAREAAGSVLV